MQKWSKIAFAVVFITQLLALGLYYPKWKLPGTEALISWDVAGYYMYLPATFIYNDIAGDSYHDSVTQTYGPSPTFDFAYQHSSGKYVMKYPLGMAIQYAPFFALSHAFAKTSNTYPADGFSRPYQVGLALEIFFFALLGLVLLRKLLLRYFSDSTVALTLIGVGIGTNYLEYSSMSGAYTHGNLFVIYLGVVLLTERFYRDPRWNTGALIGGLVGLAALTRPTELMLGLLPIIWGLAPTWKALKSRVEFLFAHWPTLLAAALFGGMILFLQPLYWHLTTGEWIVYSYQDQGFSFLRPHLLEGLASFRAGWLPYTPMGMLMLAGFWYLWQRNSQLAPAISLYMLLFCYVAWSWDIWWYGGSLGQRTMVQVYPLLAFPLAALIAKSEEGGALRKGLTGIAFSAALLLNLFWTHHAHLGGLLKVGEMTRNYYFAVLGTFHEDRNNLKLLDNALIYDKERIDEQVLLLENFESVDPAFACDSLHTLAGARSYCIREGSEFGPVLKAALPASDATWIRLSADIDVVSKTWDWWAMVQIIVSFKQGDETIAAYMLRPERLVDQGQQRIYFDGKIPKVAFDRIEVQCWKPGLGGLVVLDSLELVSFREP